MNARTCPVCGKPTFAKVYRPWIVDGENMSRYAMSCPDYHWLGRMCATRSEAEESDMPKRDIEKYKLREET